MKALVWYGRKDIRVEEVRKPELPGPNEIRVKVMYCGICGTDLEEYQQGPIYIPVQGPHPLTQAQAPLILGHEFSGVVEAVGSSVSEFQVGDHVAADTLVYCGECEPCRNHLYNLCTKLAALGLMAHGGLAEFVTAPAKTFVKIPDSVKLIEAALAEPLAVAIRGIRQARIEPGQSVLVMGAGAVGNLTMQALRVMGAGEVIVVEPSEYRRRLAEQLGADLVLSSDQLSDLDTRFHRAIDCSGRPDAQVAALRKLKAKGRLVLIGIPTQLTTLNMLEIIDFEREVVGSISHIVDEDFKTAVKLLSDGRIRVSDLITQTVPLDQAKDAFEMLGSGVPDAIKIIIQTA